MQLSGLQSPCLSLSLLLIIGVGFCPCGGVSDSDLVQLGSRLTGDVYLQGSSDYNTGSTLLNTRYSVKFRAVIYVKTTEDVRDVLLFCKQHGLVPTVRSSGHDFIGRPSCEGSVSINMRRMVANNIRQKASGPVVDVEPGINMRELYQLMNDQGYVMVGGSAPTVAPGGWTTGGGHSPMSRMFGLGVDNTVGFTIVTADGNIIKLNSTGDGTIRRPGQSEVAYSDPDLFWAVRGGGGGTFGIVTSFTYTLHNPPSGGFVHFVTWAPIHHSIWGNVGASLLYKFKQYLHNSLSAKWGGYILVSAHNGDQYHSGSVTLSLLHVGGYNIAKDAVEHMLSWPETHFYNKTTIHNTFWDYQKDVNDPTGFRVYVANRLLQDIDMLPHSNLEGVLTSVPNTKEKTGDATLLCTVTLLGGNMRSFATSSSSVSPSFRNSLGSLSCGIGWLEEKHDERFEEVMSDFSKKMDSVGDGVYLNEPNSDLPDWKTEYWGPSTNYDRLLAVKRRVDPGNLFWCLHCVGSDLVDDHQCRGHSISAATFTTLLFTSLMVYSISDCPSG